VTPSLFLFYNRLKYLYFCCEVPLNAVVGLDNFLFLNSLVFEVSLFFEALDSRLRDSVYATTEVIERSTVLDIQELACLLIRVMGNLCD
jgi:hypothetical protein